MFKRGLELANVRLQLLLHPEGLSFALGFHLQSILHTINSLHEVLAGALELLFFLRDTALNLLSDLSQLKLSPQHLVLFLFKGTFSLLKGSLQLHPLSLQTLPDLVNLVDGPATLANLVHDVLNLIAQDLVLLADLVKLQHSLLISILDAEKLR